MDQRLFVPLALIATLMSGGALAEGDSAMGERIFSQCKGCHQMGPDAKNRVGPHLNDLMGRVAGAIDGFNYSRSMERAGDEGLIWTDESLDAFIQDPKGLVPKTRMGFRGIRDPQVRADLIAYLRDYSADAVPSTQGTAQAEQNLVDPEILAIVGDPEYGEYLAGDCITCHRRDGADDGIPSITNWPTEDFVIAMHAYKAKVRPHPVMQMMAGRLANEEIAALAAYFKDLD